MNWSLARVIVQGHGLVSLAAFGAIVLPLEGHAPVVEGDEAAVRDRDAVAIAREIGEHGPSFAICGSAERGA